MKPAGATQPLTISNKSFRRDILQWDIDSWHCALAYWEKNAAIQGSEKALELGGRAGGLSLWLAAKGCAVICSDLQDVQQTAEKLHQKYPDITSLITYQDIDAGQIPYRNHFDLIVFKSIIGGIGKNDHLIRQKKVFEAIHHALKPGGKLLFAENLVASPLHRRLRKKFTRWGEHWRYITRKEAEYFLSSFSSVEMRTSGVVAAFGRTERQRNLLACADRLFLNQLIPARWHYIVYGIAIK